VDESYRWREITIHDQKNAITDVLEESLLNVPMQERTMLFRKHIRSTLAFAESFCLRM